MLCDVALTRLLRIDIAIAEFGRRGMIDVLIHVTRDNNVD
jgi:hypothetical protein